MWANAESAKQQGEAMKDYYRDMAKVMEVARRLMKGDIVPSTDEKKLMEYNDNRTRWFEVGGERVCLYLRSAELAGRSGTWLYMDIFGT